MKRYTYFDGGKWRLKIGDTEYSGDWVDRLAAYEETGLDPEELAQAKKDGQLVFITEKMALAMIAGARAIEKNKSVPFPVSWTVKMKKKQKETQDILSYHTQAAGCSDKARAKASGGRQPIEECGRTGL